MGTTTPTRFALLFLETESIECLAAAEAAGLAVEAPTGLAAEAATGLAAQQASGLAAHVGSSLPATEEVDSRLALAAEMRLIAALKT